LARNDKDTNARKFCGEIFDPADGIVVFEKRFDEQQVGAMLSNESVCLRESMCRTANLVSRVAANNCDQALLANDGIANRHDPTWFCALGSCRVSFHGSQLSNESARAVATI
jgi:hypothetical protein